MYVGSSIDISKRLNVYYSESILKKNKSYISNSLLNHGYPAFSFSILEYVDGANLSKPQFKKLILEREQY